MTGALTRRRLPGRRLLAAFVLLGLIPLILLSASTLILGRQAVERQAKERALSLNASIAQLISAPVSDLPAVLTDVGRQATTREAVRISQLHPERATDMLAWLLRTRPDLDAAFITDPTGNATASQPILTGRVFPNASHRDWFRGASHSDSAYMSVAYRSPVPALGLVVTIAVRVTDPTLKNDPTVGYLGVAYRLTGLQEAVDKFQATQGVAVTVTDKAGTVLAQPGKAGSQDVSLATDPRVHAALAGQSGVRIGTFDGRPVVSAYGQIAGTGWGLVVDLPHSIAFGEYAGLQKIAVTVTVALCVLLLGALLWAGRMEYVRRSAEEQSVEASRRQVASEQRFKAAFIHAPTGMVRTANNGQIQDLNLAACKLLGFPREELIGQSMQSIIHPDDLAAADAMAAKLEVSAEVARRVECRCVRSDGSYVWVLSTAVQLVDDNGEIYQLSQLVDITEGKRSEQQLNELALHDALTGLANRVLLETRIEHALQRLQREKHLDLAVLFIDLDGFKEINDTLGHMHGDDALREIASRLLQTVRPGDTVARLGGDEFVILCEGVRRGDWQIAPSLADRILQSVRRPGGVGEAAWQLSASIGIYQPDGEDLSSGVIISRADAAMYRAKQRGKNCLERYEGALDGETMAVSQTLELLGRAVANDRLRLHYQPVYDLRTQQIIGAEALLRLIGEDGRLCPPADFLAAALAHGQIVEFGAWSLRQACLQAASWKAELAPDAEFTIAVNMSVKEIEAAGFLDRIDAALAESGLDAAALVIELTESAFLRDLPAGRLALTGLRERGVKLALDDFGTGYSSLSYLRRFRVDIIKLDRSFVADLGIEEQGDQVTRGLIALARSLNTVLVAEGVERQDQVELLKDLGAYLAQGYLLSRPVTADAFSLLLAAQSQLAMVADTR